jgi:hypothetical protein
VKLLQLRRDVIHSPGAIYEAGSSILNKLQLLVLDVLAGRNKRVTIVKMRQHKSCHKMSRCFGIQILVDLGDTPDVDVCTSNKAINLFFLLPRKIRRGFVRMVMT